MKFIYENSAIYLIKKDVTIGYVKYKKLDEKTYDIYNTYVDPSYRGKNIGKKLIKQIYKYLKKQGYNVNATCQFAKKYLQEYNKNEEGDRYEKNC